MWNSRWRNSWGTDTTQGEIKCNFYIWNTLLIILGTTGRETGARCSSTFSFKMLTVQHLESTDRVDVVAYLLFASERCALWICERFPEKATATTNRVPIIFRELKFPICNNWPRFSPLRWIFQRACRYRARNLWIIHTAPKNPLVCGHCVCVFHGKR